MAKARERVVADMEAAGLLAEVEDREIELAHSDRSKTPIEPTWPINGSCGCRIWPNRRWMP